MTTFRERQNLSAASSLTGARFKKKLTTSDKVWGSSIVDAAISPHYTDIFDGQLEFFPRFEVKSDNLTPLEIGKVPIGQNPASVLYLLQFPVVAPPQFGSADLDSIELHIHGTDVNYKNTYRLPDLEVFKFKSEIPEVGKFAHIRTRNLAQATPERVIVGSSSYSSGPTIQDTFDGDANSPVSFSFPSLFRGANEDSTPTYYSSLSEAWKIDDIYDGDGYDDRSGANNESAYDTNYCISMSNIGRGVKYEFHDALMEVDMNMVRPTSDSGAKKTWGDDPRYHLPYYNYAYAVSVDKVSRYREELIHNMNEKTSNMSSIEVEPGTSVKKELMNAVMNTENTFFDEIYYTDFSYGDTTSPDTGELLLTSVSFPHFSTTGGFTGGQGARLFNRIESDDATKSFLFRGDKSGYTQICLIKKVPKPLKMARKDTTVEELSNMRIRIKFNINNMTKSHRSGKQDLGFELNDHTVGCNLLRAFNVMLSTRRPADGESFGLFLNRMNTGNVTSCGYDCADYDGDFDASAMAVTKDLFNSVSYANIGNESQSRVNAYNGVSIMNFTHGRGFDLSSCTLDGSTTVTHTDTSDHTPSVGMALSGTGIPANTFITAVASSTSFTMSEANTSNDGSDRTINFDDGRMVDTLGEVARFPEVQSNEDNTDGTLTLFHTGQGDASTRVNHWDGYYQCTTETIDTGVCDFVPFVHKMASTAAASAPVSLTRRGSTFTNDHDDIYGCGPDTNAFVKLSNNDDSDDTVADMTLKKWYYLDAYLNISNDYVTWVVSDTSDKVLGSVQQKHSGGRPDSTIDHKTSMFPSWLSIWVTNIQVGKGPHEDRPTRGELIGKNGYFSKTQDSEVDILIDNISISNYEPKVNNNTVTKGRSSIPSMKIEGAAEDAIPLLSTGITVGEKLGSIMGRDGDQRACTPSYISWGADINIWSENTNHIFMGGYTSNNSIYEDATDADKRIRFGKSSSDTNSQIRFFTFLNHANNLLGSGIVDYANVNMDYGPNLNDHINVGRSASYNPSSPPEMMVDSFTKKGFITITSPTYDEDGTGSEIDGAFVKTINPMFSTKIIDWDEDNPNIITVGNTDTLTTYSEDEFMIYRNGYDSTDNTYHRSALKIKDISSGKVTLEPASGALSAKYADDGSYLFHEFFIHELYISPQKYWVVAEIYNETTSNYLLPTKKYTHSVVCDNIINPEAVSLTKGVTFNERKYSDTTIPSDSWFHLNIDDKSSLIETRVDYGFGAYTDGDAKATDGESGLGYIQKFIPKEGENIVDLGGMVEVEKGRLNQPDEIITLMLKSALDNKGGSAVISTKFSDASKHPALTYIFKDEIPTVTDFKVQPSEADPFYPEFTWQTEDDDLWYGFLILDTENIAHQYHKAVMHMPLNEKPSGRLDSFGYGIELFELARETHVYTYVAGGEDTDGNTMEIGDSDTAVSNDTHTKNLLKMADIEGLAGNCLKFTGSLVGGEGRRLSFFNRYPDPSTALSINGHFTVDSLSLIDDQDNDKGYILYSKDAYSIWVDKDGKVNASVTTDDEEVTCTLISAYTVPVGRNVPTNFIFVVDTTLLTGNCKLYINGRLEDQTGFKTTDGGANNWKEGETVNNGGYNHNIGFEGVEGAPYRRNLFNGKIEELVIYSIPIYPVIPKDGKVTLNIPMREFTDGNVAAGRPVNAKLFIKDYHNIRGTIREEVASTSQIAIKKSGLGLKTSLT